MGKSFNATVDWLGMVENGGVLPGQDVNPSVNGGNIQKGLGGPSNTPRDDIMTGHMATDYQEDYQTGYQDHYTAEYGSQSSSMDKGVSAQIGTEVNTKHNQLYEESLDPYSFNIVEYVQNKMHPKTVFEKSTNLDVYNVLDEDEFKWQLEGVTEMINKSVSSGEISQKLGDKYIQDFKDLYKKNLKAKEAEEEKDTMDYYHTIDATHGYIKDVNDWYKKYLDSKQYKHYATSQYSDEKQKSGEAEYLFWNHFREDQDFDVDQVYAYENRFGPLAGTGAAAEGNVEIAWDRLTGLDPEDKQIHITPAMMNNFKDLTGASIEQIIAHEYGHLVHALEDIGGYGNTKAGFTIPQKMYNEIMNRMISTYKSDTDVIGPHGTHPDNPTWDSTEGKYYDQPWYSPIPDIDNTAEGKLRHNREHDLSPYETRADIMGLRYMFDKLGIYSVDEDPKKNPFTREMLDEFIKQDPIKNQRLLRLYKSKDIVWFMNNLADASDEIKEKQDIQDMGAEELRLLGTKSIKYGGQLPIAQDGTELERDRFVNFIKDNEGGYDYIRTKDSAIKKMGEDGEWDGESYYKIFDEGTQKYYPYFLTDEKGATIGHGHHNNNVYEDYSEGISIAKAEELLNLDVDNKMSDTEIWWTSKYGDGEWDSLDESTQYLLGDYAYNTGHIRNYKLFADAIKRGDYEEAEKQYIRKDNVGGRELARNKTYMVEYLKPWMDAQKLKLPAPPLNEMPLPIGVFPTDGEGIEQPMTPNETYMEGSSPFDFQVPPAVQDNTRVGTNVFGGWKTGGELPKFQDGDENEDREWKSYYPMEKKLVEYIDTSPENQMIYDDVNNIFSNYLQSDTYLERLRNQGYENPEQTRDARLLGLNRTSIKEKKGMTNLFRMMDTFPPCATGYPGEKSWRDLTEECRKEITKWRSDFHATGSYTDYNKGELEIDLNQVRSNKWHLGNTYAHELGHNIGGSYSNALYSEDADFDTENRNDYRELNYADDYLLNTLNKNWQDAPWGNVWEGDRRESDYNWQGPIDGRRSKTIGEKEYQGGFYYPNEVNMLYDINTLDRQQVWDDDQQKYVLPDQLYFNTREGVSTDPYTGQINPLYQEYMDSRSELQNLKRKLESEGKSTWDSEEYKKLADKTFEIYDKAQTTEIPGKTVTVPGRKTGAVHAIGSTESFSDLTGLRYWATKTLDGWTPDQEMTPDLWKKLVSQYETDLENTPKQKNLMMERMIERYGKEGVNDEIDGDNIINIMNTVADESEGMPIGMSKYGGQHNWALDLRPTTIASHGREVKNDDLYSNDRYSQNASKYKKMLPKYQSEGAWDKFEDSKVGKFVDAKGLREEKDFWMRTFGYGKGEEKDAAMDAGAIFHPGFDLAHSKTKFDEGKYLDAGLYAGFAALPFTAGPLVRGTKKHIINPIKNLFKAAPTPRGTTYNKYNQIKTSFDDLITDNADFGFGVESGIIREGNLPVRSGNLKIAVHGNAKLDEDWMVHIKKIDGGAMQLVKRPGTKNAYYLDMSMESPIDAGEALKYLEEYIPKGSTLSSNATLSLDSYKLMLNRVKRGKFSVVPGTKMLNRGLVPADNRIDLNMMSKEMSKLDINSSGMITKKEADDIVKKVNKMLSDAGVEGKAKAIDHSDALFAQGAINETHSKLSPKLSKALTWRVDLPNLTLKMEYQKGGENILPKFQDKGAWDDFKESSVGKFVDARGFERMFGMDQGIGRTFGDYFGYDSDEGKDMLLDAGAIFHPGPDFMHSATKFDEGEYTDAALYAGFGILPFTAGPLVRGTKKHIINPIKEFFSSGSSKIAGETATHVYNPASKQWIEKNTIKVNAKLLANNTEYLIKQDYVQNKIIKLEQKKIKITNDIKKWKLNNLNKDGNLVNYKTPGATWDINRKSGVDGMKELYDLQKIDNVINGQIDGYTKQLNNIPPIYTPLKKGDGFMGLEFDKAGKKWEGSTMKSSHEEVYNKLIKELDKAEKLDIERIVGDYKWDNRNIFKKYFDTPNPPFDINVDYTGEKPFWIHY